ncbi:MAG: hypothetical protein AAF602_05775 [Myxococcota bacterium]
MIVTAQTLGNGDLVHVRQLVDPDGTVVYDAEDWFEPADEQKTNAGFLASVSSLNWPVSADDPPLTPGRWSALIGQTDAEGAFVAGDVEVDVVFKTDPDFDAGRLRVVLLRSDNEDPGLEVALDRPRRSGRICMRPPASRWTSRTGAPRSTTWRHPPRGILGTRRSRIPRGFAPSSWCSSM